MPINSSADVFAWIARFINMERGRNTFKNFRLDRMRVLAEITGRPEGCAPAIHVAGSKGKGSVTGMITAILEASGLRTARYTSPDVMEKRERITLGNKFFEESIYVEAGKELVEAEAKLRKLSGPDAKLFDPALEDGMEPTFFELITLYFFLCARRARCDAMVVETGLGGRLDATNILDPLASVITLIELEHTEVLGDTITAIAGEKAGIIKPNRPLILAWEEDEALSVFRKQGAEKNSELFYFPETAVIEGEEIGKGGTRFTLRFLKEGFFDRPLKLFTPVPGAVQDRNAALAVIAAKTAFPQIEEEAVRQGLENFTLPARFEKIRESPELVIDGAHTPKSMEQCTGTFCSLYGEGGILIFGCVADKNALAMAETLVPHFSCIIITTPGTFKKSSPEDVYGIFKEKAGAHTEVLLIPETETAIEKALELGKKQGLPILGAGSFYLAAEIRKAIIDGLMLS
ncbi:bifunctional folylpolyglutamate synthase/dihydrofolate synthase [Spirochaetia bacterium]|nr:bifunctional folylpolyglutamate synthase/dihydrofolate synthase [Spirochaetia bacterium]